MFFFKKKNLLLDYAQSVLFKKDLKQMLDEFKRFTEVKIKKMIHNRFEGDMAEQMIRDRLRHKLSKHTKLFRHFYYLLFFYEIKQIPKDEKELSEIHEKYLRLFVEQNAMMLKKFQHDLKAFANEYYLEFLAESAKSGEGRGAAKNKMQVLERGYNSLGYKLIDLADKDLDFLHMGGNKFDVEVDAAAKQKIHEGWLAFSKPKKTKRQKTEFTSLMKKQKKNPNIVYLADQVLNGYPYNNPHIIKNLITFSVIIKEEKTPNILEQIEKADKNLIRKNVFFTIDNREMSHQVQKQKGEHFDKLKKDLNSFFKLVRNEDNRIQQMIKEGKIKDPNEIEDKEERWRMMASEKKEFVSKSARIESWHKYMAALKALGIHYVLNESEQIVGIVD